MKKQFSVRPLIGQIFNSLGAFFMLVSLTACSKKDDNNDLDLDFGNVTITVSGDINATFEGMADFHHLGHTSMETWEIAMHDRGPQTFSASILMISLDELERPGPGTYSIGGGLNADFSGVFTDVVDGAFHLSDEFTTAENERLGYDLGTLTITSSDDNRVNGHFQFTALLTDMDDSYNTVVLKTIHVKGEFSAHKRIN